MNEAICILLLAACAIWLAACSSPKPTQTPAPMTAAAPPEVTAVKDVRYAAAVDPDAHDQLLDITYTPGVQGRKPLVIWAHILQTIGQEGICGHLH